LSQLAQLKVLLMSDNDFSEGLPEVVSTLTSLEELYIRKCGLNTLPDRYNCAIAYTLLMNIDP